MVLPLWVENMGEWRWVEDIEVVKKWGISTKLWNDSFHQDFYQVWWNETFLGGAVGEYIGEFGDNITLFNQWLVPLTRSNTCYRVHFEMG